MSGINRAATVRGAMSNDAIWLVAVLATWLVTTALLAVLINAAPSGDAASALVEAALSATLACVVIGGPATAVALRIRRRRGIGPAALGGLGTAALIILFAWSYLDASGAPITGAWRALLPVIVVTGMQMSLALKLRGSAVPQ